MRILTIILLFTINSYSQCLTGNCNNGIGTKKIDDEEKYVGNFLNGKRNGSGITYFSNGQISFKGIWKGDEQFEGLDYLEYGELVQVWVKGFRFDKKNTSNYFITSIEREFKQIGQSSKFLTSIVYYLIDKNLDEEEITARSKQSNELLYWSEYEDFLRVYPNNSLKIENLLYDSLESKALSKNWCSYCCEVYLKLFKNNIQKRAEVSEWRRFAYNFEIAEQNSKAASENARAISDANERAKQNEPKICTTCGGRGVCMKCNGKGYTACDYHDTNNDGHCTTCNDRGILNCRTCDNKGTCNTCRGKGKIF